MRFKLFISNLLVSHLFQEFSGNFDQNTIVSHNLTVPIIARYIRFQPLAWSNQIGMRVELYGCQGTHLCHWNQLFQTYWPHLDEYAIRVTEKMYTFFSSLSFLKLLAPKAWIESSGLLMHDWHNAEIIKDDQLSVYSVKLCKINSPP